MNGTIATSRAVILVKALPQPSKRYGETVCCAGVTADRRWKRLFPIRFRHLRGESSFSRWDWVDFKHHRPTADQREESCHVHEESIQTSGSLKPAERSRLLEPLIVGSGHDAARLGQSLALIRPKNPRFISKRKSSAIIEAERDAYERAARQMGMFDAALDVIDPSPFQFRFTFEDAQGKHMYTCGDWETHAMFWRLRRQVGEAAALAKMSEVYNEQYPASGMAFAIGNQAKRPQVWQLLGVIRLDDRGQGELLV